MSTVTGGRAPAAGREAPRSIELVIGGMTCASCAVRVEKKLNKLDGVAATVNLATEQARVRFPASISTDELIAVVAQAGYTAALPAQLPADLSPGAGTAGATGGLDDPDAGAGGPAGGQDGAVSLRRRLLVSLALAVPVVLLAMVPAAQFPGWQWLSLALATPVAVWGAWPFHRAAAINARHGVATMDTLISVGVGAAYLWSLYALVFGGAGEPGMHMSFAALARNSAADAIYLDVAAGVTVLHPDRPLSGGACQAALGRGVACAAVHGRERRRGAA